MEKAGILTVNRGSYGRPAQELAKTLLAGGLWLVSMTAAMGDLNLATLDDLSAADKYRQLNLILMVSEGADKALVQQLSPEPATETSAQQQSVPRLEIEEFQTPLNRIADQREMIEHAARLFRFALDNRENITLATAQIAAAEPAQVAQVDLIQLAEDAIIIRTALTGSIEYLARMGEPAMTDHLQAYQHRTVYLRNVMEYWKFDRELVAITEDAAKATGGRMAAYQRMLEDEPNLLGFKQHLQAVEEIYRNTNGRKAKPPNLETRELIEEESQVH